MTKFFLYLFRLFFVLILFLSSSFLFQDCKDRTSNDIDNIVLFGEKGVNYEIGTTITSDGICYAIYEAENNIRYIMTFYPSLNGNIETIFKKIEKIEESEFPPSINIHLLELNNKKYMLYCEGFICDIFDLESGDIKEGFIRLNTLIARKKCNSRIKKK